MKPFKKLIQETQVKRAGDSQGQHRQGGGGAHGRQIAEAHRQCFATQQFWRMGFANKVNFFHQRVGGDDLITPFEVL